MNRTGLMVAALVFSTGCAMLKGGKIPNAAEMKAAAAKLSEAQKAAAEAVKTCPPEDGNIPLTEEKEIGGAIVVGLAQENGSFFVETATMPELATNPADVKFDKNAKNDLTAYVTRVGRLLASYSSRPELPWVFGVIENDGVNAFSAPGGYVVVTTGLMRLVDNEAQLAAVLGHEIAHVTNKDVIKSYASAKHTVCVPAKTIATYIKYGISPPAGMPDYGKFADSFDKPFDPKGGDGLIDTLTGLVLKAKKMTGSGKDAEISADTIGFELMLFAGYDTNEFSNVVRKAEQGGKTFDNHPGNVERLKNFTSLKMDDKGCEAQTEKNPNCGKYALFAAAGVVPPIPAEIKAAIPAEAPKK